MSDARLYSMTRSKVKVMNP